MTKNTELDHAQHTDKRTGIVYTNVNNLTPILTTQPQTQPYVDAFIPDSFLKHYFGNGKSKLGTASI